MVTTVTNPALGSENQNTTAAVSLAAATVATVVAPVAPETNTSEAVVGGAEQTGVTASVPAVVNVSSSTVLTPTSVATTGVNSISPQSSTSNTSIGTAVESVTLAAESIATAENANHVTNTSEKDANHTSENITNAAQSDNTTKELSSNSTTRPALLVSEEKAEVNTELVEVTAQAINDNHNALKATKVVDDQSVNNFLAVNNLQAGDLGFTTEAYETTIIDLLDLLSYANNTLSSKEEHSSELVNHDEYTSDDRDGIDIQSESTNFEMNIEDHQITTDHVIESSASVTTARVDTNEETTERGNESNLGDPYREMISDNSNGIIESRSLKSEEVPLMPYVFL